MLTYDMLRDSSLDLAPLGFEICDKLDEYRCYCTPRDAVILGCAGVDGIHYCTSPQFGEMIFSVNPMDFGDCVHPIARSFCDMLRLLLTCADMALLEQLYAWDEEQYKAFLSDNPPTDTQKAVLDSVRCEFALSPIDDVFGYVKKLQAEFDLSKIPYTEDYYDTDMNPAAPPVCKWSIDFDGGYYGNGEDTAMEEISVGAVFEWGNEVWHIPAVYVCDKGLVIDFLVEIDPLTVQAFIEKYKLSDDDTNDRMTPAQREQIEAENSLCIDFRPSVTVNGYPIGRSFGSGISYIPARLTEHNDPVAEVVLSHYGLDPEKAWVFSRYSFRLDGANASMVEEVSLKLERAKAKLAGTSFKNPSVGDEISIAHPTNGQVYTLTVVGYEQTELSFDRHFDGYEYPTNCTEMTYTVKPKLTSGKLLVRDSLESDTPRAGAKKSHDTGDDFSSAIGIIGGADGPTAIFVSCTPDKSKSNAQTVLSALHFEPQTDIEWRTIFYEKTLPDIEVRLI